MLDIIQDLSTKTTDEILQHVDSPFEFGWAAHRLLEDQIDLNQEEELACLLLLEKLTQLDHPDSSRSPFYSILAHHALLSYYRGNTNTLQLLERVLPHMLGNEYYYSIVAQSSSPSSNSFHSTTTQQENGANKDNENNQQQQQVKLNDYDHIELERRMKEWIEKRLDSDSVSPLIWMTQNPKETNELERLLETLCIKTSNDNDDNDDGKQQDNETDKEQKQVENNKKINKDQVGDNQEEIKQQEKNTSSSCRSISYPSHLLKPLSPVELPFSRPLPPPLLPTCGYDEHDFELSNPQEEGDLLDYLHAEFTWLTPTPNLRFMLLPNDEQDSKYLHDILARAFVEPLTPKDQQLLLDSITKEMIRQSRLLSQQSLPQLVEQNPLVACQCLVLVDLQNDHLSALVTMDLSVHSMEVVNRLATRTEPPQLHPEYIHLYISNCIVSCETIPPGHTQNRLVRLVCILLQSLIRNQIISVGEIYYEVEAFCIGFSRIREAASLFKLLKSLR